MFENNLAAASRIIYSRGLCILADSDTTVRLLNTQHFFIQGFQNSREKWLFLLFSFYRWENQETCYSTANAPYLSASESEVAKSRNADRLGAPLRGANFCSRYNVLTSDYMSVSSVPTRSFHLIKP